MAVPFVPPTSIAMVSESTLPRKLPQAGPAFNHIPPATGWPTDCAVIGRIDAFGYAARTCANEHGLACVHAWAAGTSPTIAFVGLPPARWRRERVPGLPGLARHCLTPRQARLEDQTPLRGRRVVGAVVVGVELQRRRVDAGGLLVRLVGQEAQVVEACARVERAADRFGARRVQRELRAPGTVGTVRPGHQRTGRGGGFGRESEPRGPADALSTVM